MGDKGDISELLGLTCRFNRSLIAPTELHVSGPQLASVMDYRASTNAICFGDLKQAALFFDRVISFAFLGMFGTGTSVIVRAPDEVPEEVVASLIYGKGSPGYKVVEYVLRHFDPFLRKISKRLAPRRDLIQHSPYDEIQRLYLQNHCTPELGSIRDDFAEFSKALGFEYSAVALPTLDDTNLTFEQAYTLTLHKCRVLAVQAA